MEVLQNRKLRPIDGLDLKESLEKEQLKKLTAKSYGSAWASSCSFFKNIIWISHLSLELSFMVGSTNIADAAFLPLLLPLLSCDIGIIELSELNEG